jgi:acetyl/propionyl-CoA carboxylase alpha subunit
MSPGGPPFRRILVANRGEIAVRIIRASHELGMEAVAVYSDADADARHVRMADTAIRLGPAPPSESYLRIDAVVEAARATGAEAIHPGYGFLSERAAFARAVEDAGLVFVGPSAAVIESLGDKILARRLARSVGVHGVPGTVEPVSVDRPDALSAILAEAERIGFPLLVKAAAGGGGRGMRRVSTPAELPAALAAGSAEAASAFGDGSVYLEREISPARHIEVQLLGDATGRVVAIGERDCSLQRRHQKLVEEAPAPGLTVDERRHLHELAVRVASTAGLRNAATAEFLRAPDGAFFFLEVNTRLQVEHGISELVAGVDIVQEQFGLAAGRPLSTAVIAAADRAADPHGHAIEVRLSAEDPSRDFAPVPGRIRWWVMPAGPGVRVDAGFGEGDRVAPDYDNLVAKIMVHADDRSAAIDRLRRALDETEVAGIQTTLPFHRFVARHDGFRAGEQSIEWVAKEWDGAADRARYAATAGEAAARAVARGALTTDAQRSPSAGQPADHVPSGPRLDPAVPRPAEDGWAAAARDEAVDRWPTSDPATGEVIVETDPDDEPTRTGIPPGEHPIVLPGGARRPTTRGSTPVEVVVAGWRFEVEVEDVRFADLRARASAGRTSATDHGPTAVRAIIPGRVVSVAVAAGDTVTAGQRLLAVEAMKMENELRAPRDGVVERVEVSVGQTVELGDPLVVLR